MADVEMKYCNGGSRVNHDEVDSCEENGRNFDDEDFGDSGDSDDDTLHNGHGQSVNGLPHNRAVNDCIVVHDDSSNSADYYDDYSHEHHHDSLESVEKDSTIVGILGKDKYEAEARLAARRQARAEAREIRMRELERQQREQEENADKAYDMHAEPLLRARGGVGRLLSPAVLQSSRRSSEDSLEESKDIRFEFKELEEKFRKTMILNAQLDNDKSALTYQLEVTKDKLEELQEQLAQLQRSHREKCSALEISRREAGAALAEAQRGRVALAGLEGALAEAQLALVELPPETGAPSVPPRLALLSLPSRDALQAAGDGTLDVRLQKLHSERQALEEEVKNLRLQLDSERSRKRTKWRSQDGMNGPGGGGDDSEEEEEAKDARRLANEYLYRACRAEQEAAALGASGARLEAQVARHKAQAERAELAEDELKAERRRLQRESREALARVEELETENSHLTKRLDKLKNAKSALLKDL